MLVLRLLEPVSRLQRPPLCLDRMHREGVPQTVRADVVHSTRFGIDQFGQPRFFGTLFDDLPGAMPVDSEDQSPAIANHRTTKADVVLKHL